MRQRSRGRRSPWFRTIVFFSLLVIGAWVAGLIGFAAMVPSRGSASSAARCAAPGWHVDAREKEKSRMNGRLSTVRIAASRGSTRS